MSKYNSTKSQVLKFLVSGFSAVLTDLLIYFLLKTWIDPSISKVISFLFGTLVSYFLNKFWTFEKDTKSKMEVVKFSMLYMTTLGVNVTANGLVLKYSDSSVLGFFTATGISTILNFIGMKWWVFRK